MKKYFVTVESAECQNSKEVIFILLKRFIALVLAIVLIIISCDLLIIKHSYILNHKTKLFHEKWCSAVPNNNFTSVYNGTKIKILLNGYVPCTLCN